MNVENIIICGDFNCVLSKERDKSLVKNVNLCDVWFDKHKELSGFTWCDGSDTPKSRIDYVLLLITLFMKRTKSLFVGYREHMQGGADYLITGL